MRNPVRVPNGNVRVVAALATMLVAALAAGCGSSNSPSGGGGSTAEQVASSGRFPALEKVVARYEKEPTNIAVMEPLPGKPVPGKTIVFIECDVPQCKQQGAGIRQSAEAVGWKYKTIQFKTADPATLITAMKDALNDRPVAVVFSGTPEPLWSQMIPAYEKAGVAMIPLFVGPAKIQGPVIANLGGELDNEIAGKVLADWFIVNSGGKGKAVLQTVPGFPAITLWRDDFKAEVAKECPKCSVDSFDVTVADLADGSSTAKTVAAVQREPSTTHVFAYNGVFIPGLTNELQNAGITDVKIGTYAATSEFVSQAVQGRDYALMANGNEYTGWLAADIAMRHSLGAKLAPEEAILPVQLLTKRSATPELAKMANDYQLPRDYKQQFKKLWGVA